MNLHIHLPLAIWDVGARANNEDAIYPALGQASSLDRLFLVCDGVGGASKGEIASQLVCEGFASYWQQQPIDMPDQAYLEQALEYAQSLIDAYLKQQPDSRGMGTTLTLLHLHGSTASIAHVGDSRVYHVRAGEIIWQTEDHSLVNELVKRGAITPAEAINHPQSNVITRAIQGNSVQSTEMDFHQIHSVQEGDYFFLCSDGILENISDETLADILGGTSSDGEKMKQMQERCQSNPNDNFSAYLVHVLALEETAKILAAEPAKTVIEPEETVVSAIPVLDPVPVSQPPPTVDKSSFRHQIGYLFVGGLLGIALLAAGLFALRSYASPAKAEASSDLSNQLIQRNEPASREMKPDISPQDSLDAEHSPVQDTVFYDIAPE